MEPLPRGANFMRSKMLWEIGLHIAGDPGIKYGGDRDMSIVVGSGGQEDFRPSLTLTTGTAIMAHDVVAGNVDMAFVNPSALLTQAYRGVGPFERPLPVRIVANYPSWDRFVIVVHESTGLETVQDVKDAKYPLTISVREDPTHSTFVLIDQIFGAYGFSLNDVLAWGGELKVTGSPQHPQNRMQLLEDGSVDAVADEALIVWFNEALGFGYRPLQFSQECFDVVGEMGWRRVVIPAGAPFANLQDDYACMDFGGWPLYTRADMPDDAVYKVCGAIAAREAEIPWEDGVYTDVSHPFKETDATPMDVPFHPGSERWIDDNAEALGIR
jgi:TRAP-type uncharacterized transport system substrate-binding protein